jgi:glycosyltransferase involved in cell wall biosynthesis
MDGTTGHAPGMLARIFLEHAGYVSDKWEHYISIYESIFAERVARGHPVRLLEIGVQNGGSLQIWSQYFPAGSTFVGIDIDPACASFAMAPTIHIRIGDASSPVALDRMLGESRFDIIIDDGSHRSDQVVATFEACFERLLPGGIYIVEDLHCSYWKSHGGGFRVADTSIERFKDLADALNRDHFEDDAGKKLDKARLERLRELGRHIARISFFDSLVVVEKLTVERQEPYHRVITGREAPVLDVVDAIALAPDALRRLLLAPPAANAFTPVLLDALASAREEVGQLRAELAQRSAEAQQRRTEAEQLRAELVQSTAEAGQLRAEVTRHARKAETAHQTAKRSAQQLSTATAGISDAKHELAQLRARAEQSEARATLAETEGTAAAARMLELDRLLAEGQAEQTRLRIELDDVLRSTFWRITGPARRAASVLPPGLRRQVRRGAKVAYWVLTPHRTRERIAYFRARRQARDVDAKGDAKEAPAVGQSALAPHAKGEPSWVYISGEPETPGHRYRVLRPAAAAESIGVRTSCIDVDEIMDHIGEIEAAEALIIWRAPWDERIAAAADAARRGGAKLVFDVDDLMIVPELARLDVIDGIRTQNLTEDAVREHYTRMRQTMAAADLCLATTEELAGHMRGRTGGMQMPTMVLPNGVDHTTVAASRLAARRRAAQREDGLIRIGYACGTRTHQRDFAACAEAVGAVLRARPRARLVTFQAAESTPYLDIEEFPGLHGVQSQIEWRNTVPLERLPDEIARFDINLAPLEIGNPFCEAKSELKLFEAALVDVPTIASPTGPYRRAIRHGDTGLLAETVSEWQAALTQLVDDAELRRRLARAAGREALWRFGPERRAELIRALSDLLHGGQRAVTGFVREVCRVEAAPTAPYIPDHQVIFQTDRLGVADVTVVVPLYNYAGHVVEALESVRAQTLAVLDLIVVEDKSTDDSLSVALHWLAANAPRFNRALLLRNRANSGLAATRNAGFEAAETPYVLPLDADNRLLPDCTAACLRTARDTGAALAYPIIQQFGDLRGLMGDLPFDPLRLQTDNYIDAMALISKAAWVAVGGYNRGQGGWEDYNLWCRFLEHGFWGERVPGGPLAEYRVHKSSMMRTSASQFEVMRGLVEEARAAHPWLRVAWSPPEPEPHHPPPGPEIIPKPIDTVLLNRRGEVTLRTTKALAALRFQPPPERLQVPLDQVQNAYQTAKLRVIQSHPGQPLAELQGAMSAWATGEVDGGLDIESLICAVGIMPLYEPTLATADELPSPILRRYREAQIDTSRRLRLDHGGAGAADGSATISILMRVFRTPLSYLERAILSVVCQTYQNWELCLVDSGSQDPEITAVLNYYEAKDRRIRVHRSLENAGFSAGTNIALGMATGSYIALLDHCDMITSNALEAIADHIVKDPSIDLVYTDECSIDENNIAQQLMPKPDWSPLLLTAFMYTGHLSAYRTSLVRQCGGLRSRDDLSDGYDLALRVADLDPKVAHIRGYHYGRRVVSGCACVGDKAHARQSNIAALQDAIDRRGWDATATALPNVNRVMRPIKPEPLVSIIIPSDDTAQVEQSVGSILAHTSYREFEILVVTNSSIAVALRALEDGPARFVRYDKPFNFSDKCNVGAAAARGEFVFFYNDDVRVITPDWIEVILECLTLPRVGAVSPKLLYQDNRIQHAGMVTGTRRLIGTAFHAYPRETSAGMNMAQSVREVSLLSAACLAMRKSVFNEIGGFDAVNTPREHSDVDLCFRIRERGYNCVYTPHAELTHFGHVSMGATEAAGKRFGPSKQDIFIMKRFGTFLADDPYFPQPMRDILYTESQEEFRYFGGKARHNGQAGVDHGVAPSPALDILIFSHDLSESGAPRAAFDTARILHEAGYYVVVASPSDGPYRERLRELGVDVVIDEVLLKQDSNVLAFARNFDKVICNTLVCWPAVAQLHHIVDTYWYVHESKAIRHFVENVPGFAEVVEAGVPVWADSRRAARYLGEYSVKPRIIEYGTPDLANPPRMAENNRGKVVIGVFGTYERRKGQDLAVGAMLRLTPRLRDQAELRFFGRTLTSEADFRKDLERVAAGEESIVFSGEVDHHECLCQMAASDVILVPSRDDALSFVALDALSLGKALVCSSTTGASEYLEQGKSALILNDNTPEEIAEALARLISNPGLRQTLGEGGRQIYDTTFKLEHFGEKLQAALGLKPAPGEPYTLERVP